MKTTYKCLWANDFLTAQPFCDVTAFDINDNTNGVHLGADDALALGVDLVTRLAYTDKSSVVAFAEAMIEEHGTTDTPQIDPRVEMENPEVIHGGYGWDMWFDADGLSPGMGFVRIDNGYRHGGAYVHPASMLDLAESIIDRFGEDDDAVIAMAERLIADRTDEPAPHIPGGYLALSDQAKTVFQHMRRAGSISARDAMADHDMTSATLSRRICDIEQEGFRIIRERRQHSVTGKRYTRYSLADGQ